MISKPNFTTKQCVLLEKLICKLWYTFILLFSANADIAIQHDLIEYTRLWQLITIAYVIVKLLGEFSSPKKIWFFGYYLISFVS